MPLPKPMRVLSPDEVRIRRDGDAAILEPADAAAGTTRFVLGAERVARMTDAEILALWNESVTAQQEYADALGLPTIEIPPRRPPRSALRTLRAIAERVASRFCP